MFHRKTKACIEVSKMEKGRRVPPFKSVTVPLPPKKVWQIIREAFVVQEQIDIEMLRKKHKR